MCVHGTTVFHVFWWSTAQCCSATLGEGNYCGGQLCRTCVIEKSQPCFLFWLCLRCKARCKSLPHQSTVWVFKLKWLCSSKGLLIKLKFQISWLTRNITWSTVSITHTNQWKRAWTENKGPFLLRVLLWGPVMPAPSSPRKHITPPGIKIFTYYIMCVFWRQRYQHLTFSVGIYGRLPSCDCSSLLFKLLSQ